MRGTIGFSPEYLVIGTNNHNGEVKSLNWTDTRIQTLDLSRFNTIVLNFNSIETNLDKENYTINIFTKNGTQMMNMGYIDENVFLNLVNLNNYLSSLNNKISLIYVYTPTNSFADILFSKQLIVDKEWTELHNIPFSTIFPQQLEDFNLVDMNLNISMVQSSLQEKKTIYR